MASPTLCEVIYDIDLLRRRSATCASASGAATAAACSVELPSTLTRSQTTMTSYRYSSLADSGRGGSLSRASTSPVVRSSAACSRDGSPSLVRGISELTGAGKLSAHRPRHSRTAVGSRSAVCFRFPTEAVTRSSADSSWPYIADFLLSDQPFHPLDGTHVRLRWDDKKNIWIAHPYKPVAGWYLKFVDGLALEERHQEADQKRYQLLRGTGTEAATMSPAEMEEFRARKAEELKRWKRRRMLQLLNARMAGSRAAADEKTDKSTIGYGTTSGLDTSLDGQDDVTSGKRRLGEGEEDDSGSISTSADDGVGSSTINSDRENAAGAAGDDDEVGGGRRRRRKALPTATRRRVKFQRDKLDNEEDGDSDDEGRSTKSGTSRDVDGSITDADQVTTDEASASGATSAGNAAKTESTEPQSNSAAGTGAADKQAVAAANNELDPNGSLHHQPHARPQPAKFTTVCVNCGRIIDADATEPHQCRKLTPLHERSQSGGHRRVGTPGEPAAAAVDRRGPLRRKPTWLTGGGDPEPQPATLVSDEESARRDSFPPPLPSPRVSLGQVQRPSVTVLESRPGRSPDLHSVFKDVLAERQRRRLEARRRRRDSPVYRRFKGRRPSDRPRTVDTDSGNLEDYDWLSKYCILDANRIKMYQATFEDVDIDCAGRLDCIDTMIALQAVNSQLNDADEEFIYTIMEAAGYSITSGSDSRLFALLAALSFRITSLDAWMRNIIRSTDCRALANKMLKCKTLWECCIRAGSKTISIDELCVELRAGGVREDHEQEVRAKLGPPRAPLDLLDFLTYAPLFVMIHSSVIDNPLNDTRDK